MSATPPRQSETPADGYVVTEATLREALPLELKNKLRAHERGHIYVREGVNPDYCPYCRIEWRKRHG